MHLHRGVFEGSSMDVAYILCDLFSAAAARFDTDVPHNGEFAFPLEASLSSFSLFSKLSLLLLVIEKKGK